MIRIDGQSLPIPSSLQVGIMDISNASRNAQGDMVIDRIATKRKLELAWDHLSAEQLSSLLQRVSPVLFTVEFPDPQDGTTRTGTFYCGDRTVGALDYKNGVVRWKDIKFNLVER